MAIFKVEGSIEVSIQVEARDETQARKLIEEHLSASVGCPQHDRGWDKKCEYMEIIDSSFDPDDFDIEYEGDEDNSCPTCMGSGGGPEGHLKCPRCGGKGTV